jgi:hypothetical protein
MIVRAFGIEDWALRGQLVCTHIGFILLNMATMPFWQIEGLILYALVCGYTYSASLMRGMTQAPNQPEGRRRAVANPYLRRRAG